MNYALIGCGRIAVNHIKAALNNKLNLVAVCAVLPEKMAELLAKYDLQNDDSIARYTDYKKLLADHPDLQLASIATESGIHAEIALACIDAGVFFVQSAIFHPVFFGRCAQNSEICVHLCQAF